MIQTTVSNMANFEKDRPDIVPDKYNQCNGLYHFPSNLIMNLKIN